MDNNTEEIIISNIKLLIKYQELYEIALIQIENELKKSLDRTRS